MVVGQGLPELAVDERYDTARCFRRAAMVLAGSKVSTEVVMYCRAIRTLPASLPSQLSFLLSSLGFIVPARSGERSSRCSPVLSNLCYGQQLQEMMSGVAQCTVVRRRLPYQRAAIVLVSAGLPPSIMRLHAHP